MARSQKSFCEKRRAALRAIARLDQLEPRVPVTEPINFAALSLGTLRWVAELGSMHAQGGG